MSALGALGIAGGVTTMAVPIGTVIKLHAPVRPTLKYVLPAVLATVLLTPIAAKDIPVIGLAVACLPGYLACRGAHRHASVTWPRRVTAALLESRLKPVIGDPWTGRAMRISYEPPDSADPADIARVIIKIPRAVLPSKITDKCKEILTETLGGPKKKWKASTAETMIMFTPKAEAQDPRALKHLKSVLLDQRALGVDGDVKVLEWDQNDGSVTDFIGYASPKLANAVANTTRQAAIANLVRTRVPIASGSWVITWDVTRTPTMHCYRSAFQDIIYKPVPAHFVTSREEAAERYPRAVFEIGISPEGRVHTRTPIKEPNGITTGAPGKGKTTHLHVMLTEAARWGFMIIVIDGKFSDSFIGFRDWPGVVFVANDILNAIRAIFFIDEMLTHRQDGGRTNEYPVDDNIPIYVIIDEYPFLVKRIADMWSILRGEDDEKTCPAITVMENLGQMVRQFRIHIDPAAQKPDGERVSQNIIYNSDKKSQWGKMTGAQSNAFWGDYHTGLSIPPVEGRGIIKTLGGEPEEIQGYYVPDPMKIKTRADMILLAKLMPPVSLYRRIVFDIPDPMNSGWHAIATAKWRFAEDRPDLDPMSPKYDPPKFMRYNTFGNLNPATLDIDEPNGQARNGDHPSQI
jgi:hypothetical protein